MEETITEVRNQWLQEFHQWLQLKSQLYKFNKLIKGIAIILQTEKRTFRHEFSQESSA